MTSLVATFFKPWVLFHPSQLAAGEDSMLEHVDGRMHHPLAELGKAASSGALALVGV